MMLMVVQILLHLECGLVHFLGSVAEKGHPALKSANPNRNTEKLLMGTQHSQKLHSTGHRGGKN